MSFAPIHGHAGTQKTAVYHAWCSMRQRCSNSNHPYFHRYGGRGIKVCARWDDFTKFLEDIGEPSESRMHLDRIDNDGNYEPGNVRWVNAKTNARNRSSNKHISFKGKTMTVADWAEELGLPYRTLDQRLRNPRWDIERALTTPWLPRNKRR